MGNTLRKLVFTFPGQGSFNGDVLRELYDHSPDRQEFQRVDEIPRLILGHEFLPLVKARTSSERDSLLKSCPELDQVAIYLTNYLIASDLIASGLRPDLVLGHSFGELAALAIAGVYSFETGLRIVCQRSTVLRAITSGGKMAAASSGADRISEIILSLDKRSLGKRSLEIAVINHARQTVISGLPAELDELREVLAKQGIGLTVLKSRYPFHSSLLQPSVAPFQLILCSYAFRPAAIPVFLCTEGSLYSSGADLPRVLSEQFIKRLDFAAILRELHKLGFRQFVECGAGNIVTKVTLESGLEGITALPAAPLTGGVREGYASILREFGAETPVSQSTAELAGLVTEMRAVLERASRVLAPIETPPVNASPSAFAALIDAEEYTPDVEPCEAAPIAIVSMGCVLPGAHNPEQYWNNILNGVSGIADLGLEDETAARDFLAGDGGPEPKIVSDKTYTLLSGSAGTISYDEKLLAASYSEVQFNQLTRAEKLLALAAGQALTGFKSSIAQISPDRIECVLGATADGSSDYDYAVFRASMEETLEKIEPDATLRKAFSPCLRRIWGDTPGAEIRTSQNESCAAVIGSSAGRAIRTYIIDAACSSSLYAIGLGVTALQDYTKDIMLVGGVFAPALANSALFAQFRGLSPNASRPLDVSADGVIFGEGAGILVLKRLSDAMASGDRVLGVVRGVGVSSDGKSPAINVPQSKGQSIAIRRAYQDSHIDMNSIQYVEAHATATPVGDAVEFGALRQAISRDPSLPKIELGSVKALVGHTGWAAGAASVIKLCKAFETRTIPPQYNYDSPSPEIGLNDSPFRISTAASPWPVNTSSLPRRAAINGFGFGGTNAHLIIEEFHPAFHRKLCSSVATKSPEPTRLAVIASACLFPSESGPPGVSPTHRRGFTRSALRLPKGKMLLPDVTDHMDAGQFLALLAAEKVLPALGDKLKELRGETGVVIGVESKTERGIRANQRIFLDRLKRRFAEDRESDGFPLGARGALIERLCAAVQTDVIPSGPYTLPGLMPNVISGRVANMFELNGPNVVIDMGVNSLFQSILVARDFLAHGDCKAVLAGGLNAVCTSPNHAETVFLTLLTTEATARELNLPVACYLTVGGLRSEASASARTSVVYRGAEGVIELSDAIAKVQNGQNEVSVAEPRSGLSQSEALIFSSARPVAQEPKLAPQKAQETAPASGTYAYVQGTPIYTFTPVETPVELPAGTRPAGSRRFLFLTDQPGDWKQIEKTGVLQGLDYHVLSAKAGGLANSTTVDFSSDEAVKKTLAALPATFNVIVPVKFSGDSLPDALLTAPADGTPGLMDLAFAVCRRYYDELQRGGIALGSLCLGAFIRGRLNPFSGLLSGFVKSLARELPSAVCRSLNLAETDFRKALAALDSELSAPGSAVEICYRGGNRSVIQLARLEHVSRGESPLLNSNSVVLATGGGRGVTAVLAEELLTRFGCTVIAVGRTDPSAAPPELLKMSAAQLAAHEQEFYRSELAKGGGKKIPQLRDQFRAYQAAHEVSEIVQNLSALPGRFEYISADITNRDATTAIVESVFQKCGRLDLVLHGAGIQISKLLTKKTVGDFRNVVGAKIASLQYIYQACEKRRAGRPVHYHLLTSAFSYMGNDGQPDYGAANEALNRLADVMAPHWCSVAWLGWAGIGMTRGSEFAALAANRGLRGITKIEGQEIFSKYLVGEPTAPINILMADGELKFYDVATTPNLYAPMVAPSAPSRAKRNNLTIERTVTADGAPYILNHRVDGVPTLPGAFLIMIVAEAALELRPDLKITAFEDASFRRFVRLRSDGPTKLRLNAILASEDERSTLVRVQVVSDFTHKSGMVLQKDVVQTEISVRMGPSVNRAGAPNGLSRPQGRILSDPYVMEGSPVHLNGPFRTLTNIVVGASGRSADYKMQEGENGRAFLSSLMVMDSLWRFGAIDMDTHNTLPVYVPEACKVMKVYFDLTNPGDSSPLSGGLSMTGSNPTADDDKLTIGPVEVRDHAGSILLTVDGGVCRKLGEVRDGKH
jgi:acyl transferase domain-containing protein/NAD(P)-dependent dehydrogenase (short-subunit alcohol dehydrogenase family)